MKKLILLVLLFMLAGCEVEEEYNIDNYILLTDVKVDKIYEDQVGKVWYYYIKVDKDKKLYDFEVSLAMLEEIETLTKTAKMLNAEEILFDVVTDGEYVTSITLSKNRK